MWTYKDFEEMKKNATIRRHYKDGIHRSSQILAHEGYCLKAINDEGFTDEEGNYTPPTYSYQVSIMASRENELLTNYEILLIQEDTEKELI